MVIKFNRGDAVIKHIGLSEARARLGAVAALVDIEEFEDLLELRDPEVQRIIEESREDELAGRMRPARQLLAELRADEEEEEAIG
jgi:hypothetical protein